MPIIDIIHVVLLASMCNSQLNAPIISNVIHTWWHNNTEYNDYQPVADDHVRGSTFYHVQVSTQGVEENILYDSFTYMSIPRSGKEKWGYNDSDGAEFASRANLTMSWSTFQYSVPVWVIVTLLKPEDRIQSENDVTIRPTTLNFQKRFVNSQTIRILVPYRTAGYRFSVEFKSKLFTTYNINNNPSENTNGRAIHTEPRDALLIFAESIVIGDHASDYIPNVKRDNIYYVPSGRINDLNSINQSVIYFEPGIYYMPWNYHAHFLANVQWVYLAPGAYVKGAFEFKSTENIKITGLGVLSGETYVYEADTANNYRRKISEQCWATCVKMLRFSSQRGKQQHLYVHGITINEPPYHSFVVYGDEQSFHMSVSSYHQVGSWYWQTDGLEIYSGSTLTNTFLHSNDDVLKIYHSHVRVQDIVVWKNENGPVIQWGWSPRTISNVVIDGVEIIHNRIWWTDVKINTCIINSASHYADTDSTRTADPSQHISNLTILNIRSEGKNPCFLRVYALSSTQSITIKNIWIEQWNELDKSSQVSHFKAYSDRNNRKVIIGNQSSNKRGLSIENYMVGREKVTKAADNWRDIHLGRLGFDAELWNSWDAI